MFTDVRGLLNGVREGVHRLWLHLLDPLQSMDTTCLGYGGQGNGVPYRPGHA